MSQSAQQLGNYPVPAGAFRLFEMERAIEYDAAPAVVPNRVIAQPDAGPVVAFGDPVKTLFGGAVRPAEPIAWGCRFRDGLGGRRRGLGGRGLGHGGRHTAESAFAAVSAAAGGA